MCSSINIKANTVPTILVAGGFLLIITDALAKPDPSIMDYGVGAVILGALIYVLIFLVNKYG